MPFCCPKYGLGALLVFFVSVATAKSRVKEKRSIDIRGKVENVTLLAELRHEAAETWHYAHESYLSHGFPWDEICPLTCTGRRWDVRGRGTLDDSLGGFPLTAVDALPSLAQLGDASGFRAAVRRLERHFRHDREVTVSVFESTIRVVGALVSAHGMLEDAEMGPFLRRSGPGAPLAYNGSLLRMASGLADRLLASYDATASGLPLHLVRLSEPLVTEEIRKDVETCTAAAGTALLEFGALSAWTGNVTYVNAAAKAVAALFDRRSPSTGLIGSTLDANTGQWRASHTGVGAGVDSFVEYLLKGWVLTGNDGLRSMWEATSAAIQLELSLDVGTSTAPATLHREASMSQGRKGPRPAVLSSLQAFYPGSLVLDGRIAEARAAFRPLVMVWAQYGALPEAYDVVTEKPITHAKDAPLRPELVESTYLLYEATRDPWYLAVGQAMLQSLRRTKTKCGLASIANVQTGRLDDRMDSYVLAETLKYLYLLFDTALANSTNHYHPTTISFESSTTTTTTTSSTSSNPLLPNTKYADQVLYTTEGHPLLLSSMPPIPSGEWSAILRRSAPSTRQEHARISRRRAIFTDRERFESMEGGKGSASVGWSDSLNSSYLGSEFVGDCPTWALDRMHPEGPEVMQTEADAWWSGLAFSGDTSELRHRATKAGRKESRSSSSVSEDGVEGFSEVPQTMVGAVEALMKQAQALLQSSSSSVSTAMQMAAAPVLATASAGDSVVAAVREGEGVFRAETMLGTGDVEVEKLARRLTAAGVEGIDAVVMHCKGPDDGEADRKCSILLKPANEAARPLRATVVATAGGGRLGTIDVAGAQFGPQLAPGGVAGPLGVLQPLDGCDADDVRLGPNLDDSAPSKTSSTSKKSPISPFVAVAVRGGCSFAAKARAASALGASAILIVDLDLHTTQPDGFSMADDGQGPVGIPAALALPAHTPTILQALRLQVPNRCRICSVEHVRDLCASTKKATTLSSSSTPQQFAAGCKHRGIRPTYDLDVAIWRAVHNEKEPVPNHPPFQPPPGPIISEIFRDCLAGQCD